MGQHFLFKQTTRWRRAKPESLLQIQGIQLDCGAGQSDSLVLLRSTLRGYIGDDGKENGNYYNGLYGEYNVSEQRGPVLLLPDAAPLIMGSAVLGRVTRRPAHFPALPGLFLRVRGAVKK